MSNDVAAYMNRMISELNQYMHKEGCRDYGLLCSALSACDWERSPGARSFGVLQKRVHNSRFTTVVGKQFIILDDKGRHVGMDNVPKEAVVYIDQHISEIKEALYTINSI